MTAPVAEPPSWPWPGSTHGALVKIEIVGRPEVPPLLLAARSIGFAKEHGVTLLSVLGDDPVRR